jgi:hypothetical protein
MDSAMMICSFLFGLLSCFSVLSEEAFNPGPAVVLYLGYLITGLGMLFELVPGDREPGDSESDEKHVVSWMMPHSSTETRTNPHAEIRKFGFG